MPEVRAFRGFRYDAAKTGEFSQVVTPPYDVISSMEREALGELSAYNMVHVILPEEQEGKTRYEVARETLLGWIEDGALRQDDAPSYYLLRQRFTDLAGAIQVRRGFFAAVKLPEPGERSVLGHERTFAKPVEDRLRLTEATEANLGPVFLLYEDADKKLAGFLGQMDARPPDLSARTIDGTLQELWRVDADATVSNFLMNQTLYIADGHHRFRTAVTYRDQMREKHGKGEARAYDYALAGLVAFDDPGLQIWPPHRLVNPPENFDAEVFLEQLEQWFDVLPEEGIFVEQLGAHREACTIGLCMHGIGNFILTLRDIDRSEFLGDDRGPAWRALDVAVLHRGILERILNIPEGTAFEYEKNAERAVKSAQSGTCGLAFLLRGIRPEEIRDCADADEPMPQKSTYFFPKLPTGAVIHRLC